MRANWRNDKRRADVLMPEIRQILGEHLINAPRDEEDEQHNTDLIVLGLGGGIRIGVRVRDERYAAAYGGEFTLRSVRKSGTKTELAKVVEGWGDYFFYGFANEDWTQLVSWTLCDLNVFRLWFNRSLYRLPAGETPGTPQRNRDGSSEFIAFRIDELPTDFVVAQRAYQRLGEAA